MAKQTDISLDDLKGLESSTPPSDMEARLAKIEMFMKRFDGSNMNLTDRQVVYHATFTAILQGLLQFNPSMMQRPDMLHNYLKNAKHTAELAVVLHDGGTKSDFTGEFMLKKNEKE